MDIEKDPSTCVDNYFHQLSFSLGLGPGLTVMQRPRIAPKIKPRRKRNAIKRRAYITDDPEDQPERRPWHANHHGHILTCQTKRDHADVVDHPVHRKTAVVVGGGGICDFGWRRWGRGERDLEGERDEGVEEGEEEVGCYCC